MQIITKILEKNPCYTTGRKITVKGLMIHSVGCNQPNALVFVNRWNDESYSRACVHAFIDGNSGDVYQTLPWNHRGWHAGGSANNTHIGVEMCEPSTIKYTGGSTWKETSDGKNTQATVIRTYNSAVELFAKLCKDYNLDPLKKGVIISHNEGAKVSAASNHGDPEHIWSKFGITMDKFRWDIYTKMNEKVITRDKISDGNDDKVLYKVQVGAFSKKDNADKVKTDLLLDGFNGFITKVNNIYKVQVGAFAKRENAEAMLLKVKNKGYGDSFISNTSGAAQISQTEVLYEGSAASKKTLGEIAKEVLAGDWGNGEERKQKLEAAGYKYDDIRTTVNALLSGQKVSIGYNTKTVEEVAKEVIDGKYGNGEIRKQKLKAAGWDPTIVQAAVNKILKKK